MKMRKKFHKSAATTLALSENDIAAIAEAISLIVLRNLSGRIGTGKAIAMTGSSSVQMDESLIDVGISTAGIHYTSEGPIGKETTTEDDVTSATDKLKALKRK